MPPLWSLYRAFSVIRLLHGGAISTTKDQQEFEFKTRMTQQPANQRLFGESIRKFVRLKSSGGIVLMVAVVLASLLASVAGYVLLRLSCPKPLIG